MDKIIQNLDIQQPGIWFPLMVAVILLVLIILMPKRQITRRGMYITFGVVGYVGLVLDVNLLGTYFDWFDLGSRTTEGIGDLASYGIIPPCLAILYLNYLNRKNFWQYVTLFSVISLLFEIVLTQVGYMTLKGWRHWYSVPVFILIYGVWLPWHYKILQPIGGIKTEQGQCLKRHAAGIVQPAMKPLKQEKNRR